MSRYTGPRRKILRALGVDLPGLSRQSLQARPQPPGQHGARKQPIAKSGYGQQLLEKQKLRFNYGLTENQLRRVVADAKKDRAATGGKLVELLERRLDNLVFRAGFAPTIPAARQLIAHGHIRLNGRRITIPSIRAKTGDRFGPRETAVRHPVIRQTLADPTLLRPAWIAFDAGHLTATLSHLPDAMPPRSRSTWQKSSSTTQPGCNAMPAPTLPSLKIHPHTILDCLIRQRFGVEYQPMICVHTGETRCHEALARFVAADGSAMPPDQVFEALHDNPLLLLHAELETKRLQLAEAPGHGLLFVNLDPDSYAAGEAADGANLFLPLLGEQRQRLVVEVIENLHLQDVDRSARMMAELDGQRIRQAIDDLSSSRGIISYAALMNAAFLKFDRSWLARKLSTKQRTILTWALAQAVDLGLTTVLEGVETEEHMVMARQYGFDLAQGFLFRDRFIRRGCQARQPSIGQT